MFSGHELLRKEGRERCRRRPHYSNSQQRRHRRSEIAERTDGRKAEPASAAVPWWDRRTTHAAPWNVASIKPRGKCLCSVSSRDPWLYYRPLPPFSTTATLTRDVSLVLQSYFFSWVAGHKYFHFSLTTMLGISCIDHVLTNKMKFHNKHKE